ncbi:MAG TPA: heme lyase CcmF/NrfE family subunit [Ktedonobacterales bacterium]|nr:heme lyase CcmF/NrfE family subunit [Ktedonobacterales bacterium]
MHFSDLGMIAQLLALVFAAYALATSVLGARRGAAALLASSRRAVVMVALFCVLAVVTLSASFLTRDFGARYVAEHSSRAMPIAYTVAAFYSGQEGSLLYWCTMLALFSALAVALHRRAPAGLMPWVVAVLMSVDGFFLFVLNFVSTPFDRLRIAPADGRGLNPILQDPGMLVHPPMLLLGYMSWTLPFAFAMAALITGRLDAGWLRAIRRWTLAAWSIQTTGLLLGAWWAYHVLGWGGYWGWDPVENAALLPWLTATAFLHSTMVQERRGSLKVWNLALILATFALSLFGTFEVRSGIITSVHSFAYSAIGPWFLGFLAVVVALSIGLFVRRLPRLRPEHEFDSVVSREGSFLLNNFLLTGIAFATFWGTIFPILSETIRGQTMTVGKAFYERANGPLFLALLFVMGVGPLLAWRRATLRSIWRNCRWPALFAAFCALALPLLGVTNLWANVGFAVCAFAAGTILYELWRGVRVRHGHGEGYLVALISLVRRHRQRYGGYLVHLGLVVLAVGVIGSQFFQVERDFTLQKGQTGTVAGYAITYQGISGALADGGVQVVTTRFALASGGQSLGTIVPGERIFPGFEDQPTSIVSITTHGLNDLYVFLSGYEGTDSASIKVFLNPLVPLVWLGGILMLLGGITCWWPERRKPARRVVESQRTKKAAPAEVVV